jgi:hypothetical protein
MNISTQQLSLKILLLASALAMWGCGSSGDGGNGAGGDGGSGGSGGAVGSTPIANAGPDADVSKGFTVNLDGSGSSDPDGGSLTYTWTQTNGPDVTGGTGALTGENPTFSAPDAVDTLVFELVVNNGSQDSPIDTVRINVFEDLNVAYFVDGDTGDDETGTGSRDNPFATVAMAASELTTNLEDIYVKTLGAAAVYDESAANLDIPSGTSLYGGYTNDWVRDLEGNKTPMLTNHRGVQFFGVAQDAWFSGFDLRTTDSTSASEDVFGVSGEGNEGAALYVEDNIITTGNVQAGESDSPGTNYGVALRHLSFANVSNNVITAGRGGDGSVGDKGSKGDSGSIGADASGNGTASGGSGGPGGNGGIGGARGAGPFGNGDPGGGGESQPRPLGGDVPGGGGGAGGSGNNSDPGSVGGGGNTGGAGVPGDAGSGAGVPSSDGALFAISHGRSGGRGGDGSGGGGGGGGEANFIGIVGGGGGGGGEGGQGGGGGLGGRGGGASIGVWLAYVGGADLSGNTIVSGAGGAGADSGDGGDGGGGGRYGDGESGTGGNGARGGSGGTGGIGGAGGGGGGGPSYGVIFAPGMAPTLTGNTITSGDGAQGGGGGAAGKNAQGGFSFSVYDRDPTDGFFATLSQNTLTSGTPGMGGGADGAAGESGTRNWQ